MADRFKEFFDEGDPDKIFILEEEIASGSFGSVYKGRHYQTGAHYAVKIITPEEDEVLDDFMVEISVLKKCNNPNIVGYFGAWLKGEELFIAMELCDGGAITDIFSVCQESLEEDQIALITRETLKSLAYLHSLGIIHRDIKGANILLTNSGEIKLVDFGVSAELKHPGDRRNTLIGTPYWMSPEVIANKTGNVPYDTKADMWSLGITLLELADMNPPLHEIHPMKALMMIPMRDPPTFQNPDKWTREFRDFINICLRKQPEKRQTADEMLKHAFVTNCKDKSVLIDLIQKRKRLEALEENVSEEEEDDSEGEPSSDEEEAPVSSPPPKSNPIPPVTQPKEVASESPPTSSKKEEVKAPTPIPSSPSVSKIETTKKKERDTPSTPITPNPQGTGRGGAQVVNNNKPNRPTYRTNKKMTNRQIKQHEQQILNKKMVQKRLQEIRALNKEHENQEKRLLQRQQRDQTALKDSMEAKFQNMRKHQQSETKKIGDNHKTDKETIEKEVTSISRKLEKEQKVSAEKNLKKLSEESKSNTKEFKKKLKQEIEKEAEKLVKEKVPKPEREQKSREAKCLLEWKEKEFSDKQAREKFSKDYDQRHRDSENHHRHVRAALGEKHGKHWRHLRERQTVEIEQLQSLHQLENERLKSSQPQETNHLIERFDLKRKQLQEQQKMESDQQQKILLFEQKQQKLEAKKAQNKKKEDLQAEIRKLLREDKRNKQRADELRSKLKAELEKEDLQFNENQRKQREEEDGMIQRHHQAKEIEFEDQRKEAISKLETEQEETRKKLKEDHEQQEKELYKRHLQEQKEIQKEFHDELRASLSDHHRVLNDILKEYLQNQRKLYEDQHKEQIALKQKHKADESDLQALLKEHEEDLALLSQKQQKEVEVQEQQNQMETSELEELLTRQKKQMEEQHIADPKGTLSYIKNDFTPPTPDSKKKKQADSVRIRGSKDSIRDSAERE